MLDTTLFYAVAIPAVTFAGLSKGGFGSGGAMVATPILAIVVGPGTALGVMLPLLMVMDVASLGAYWRKWSWPDARRMIIGGLPGVIIGAALWRVAPDDVFRVLIGIVSLGFVFWQVAGRRLLASRQVTAMPDWGAYIAGTVSGFTSFVSHAGGPPVAMYLLSRGLTKTGYQATTVLLFWALNAVKVVPYTMLGIFSVETLRADLLLAPCALFGTWLGVKAHRIVPERLYFGVTYTMLVAAGSKLLWDAIT